MFYKLNDSQFYYKIIGIGTPVLLLHGCSLDHNLFTGCMEPMFEEHKGYQRIYFDLPGMGKSDAPCWINNSDDILDLILNFIKDVIRDQEFLLVGESYGGYLARGILTKFNEQVKGLFLLCPVIIPTMNERDCPENTVLIKDHQLLSELSKKEREQFCDGSIIQNREVYLRFMNEIAIGLNCANENFINNFQKSYSFRIDIDSLPESKFDKPVLMLMGKQDSCVGYRDQWNILKNYKRATFSVLDMAGHNLQIENKRLFDSLVIDWIDRIEMETFVNNDLC